VEGLVRNHLLQTHRRLPPSVQSHVAITATSIHPALLNQVGALAEPGVVIRAVLQVVNDFSNNFPEERSANGGDGDLDPSQPFAESCESMDTHRKLTGVVP
jgi:hypothetical protein